MQADSSSNSFFEVILNNIVPILFILFMIIGQLTRVKKTKATPQEDTFHRESEDERDAKEQIRQLIESRRTSHETPTSSTHTQHHVNESALTKPTTHIPVKSSTQPHPTQPTLHTQEYRTHTLSYEDYTEQLAQQQKKIAQAKALRTSIEKEDASPFKETEISSTQSSKTLADIFANKTPLQQAILAKEILDAPMALRNSHR